MKKSDVIRDNNIEKTEQKPFNADEETKPGKPRWLRWVKVIINFITGAFSF